MARSFSPQTALELPRASSGYVPLLTPPRCSFPSKNSNFCLGNKWSLVVTDGANGGRGTGTRRELLRFVGRALERNPTLSPIASPSVPFWPSTYLSVPTLPRYPSIHHWFLLQISSMADPTRGSFGLPSLHCTPYTDTQVTTAANIPSPPPAPPSRFLTSSKCNPASTARAVNLRILRSTAHFPLHGPWPCSLVARRRRDKNGHAEYKHIGRRCPGNRPIGAILRTVQGHLAAPGFSHALFISGDAISCPWGTFHGCYRQLSWPVVLSNQVTLTILVQRGAT